MNKNNLLIIDAIDLLKNTYIRFILFILNIIPGRPGNIYGDFLRIKILRLLKIKIGFNSQISPGFFVYNMGLLESGVNCRFGYSFQVWNFSQILIGSNLLASHGLKLISGNHKINKSRGDYPGEITIGSNVWLGANVTIVGPCTIADGIIVGANSFVTGNLNKIGWIYAGSPARAIREIGND